ncbi:MAG TPA: hypothetical protein VMI75_09185 [Polyangiaceae bacterium]|nr:hypothetical protein [Polyangiaceae bacterium]
MEIGVIGRLGSSEAAFRDLASAVGHEVWFHDRVIGGRHPEELGRFIDGCAVVVILIDATSPALARLAREQLERRHRTPLLLSCQDLGRFVGLMAALAGIDASRPLLRTGTDR